MKMFKVIMPMVCLCTLTACGTKVTKEEFVEEALKTEDHDFKSIQIKYVGKENENKEEFKNTYTLTNGEYVAEKDNDYADRLILYATRSVVLAEYMDVSFKSYETKDKEKDIDAKIEWEIKYYLNPFKITGHYSSVIKNKGNGISGSRKAEFKYEYNKYGYLTFNESKYEYELEEKLDGLKNSEKTSQYTKVSISYKD